jgi:hypothetical protein
MIYRLIILNKNNMRKGKNERNGLGKGRNCKKL